MTKITSEHLITEYNKLIEKIVFDFAQRYYLELYQEPCQESDYDIMNYVWINSWMIEISDCYYDINDILIAELYQIPIQIMQDWYYLRLEDKIDENLYNFHRKVTNPWLYNKEEAESLRRSKENVEFAKNELIKYIKEF